MSTDAEEAGMSVLHADIPLTLLVSPFPPLAVRFMGLGTGYLIYGTQELFGYPVHDERVDLATRIWGIWMPGFMQFITGTCLFLGLALFGAFIAAPLYMAARVHRLRLRRASWASSCSSTQAMIRSVVCSSAWPALCGGVLRDPGT
jgi:hypothetical protein